MTTVDLVVNCFERNYRNVLRPGFFPDVARQCDFDFARRVALINNVDHPREVLELGQTLQELGDIDEVVLVADRLTDALETTGLTREELGRVPHYTDCALVAATLPGSPWLIYWDPDVTIAQPCDWITPAIALLDADPRLLAASPNWTTPELLQAESREPSGEFQIGPGFSDQLFLARRADLARPIYGHRCVASWRYPMSHIAMIFEARVDAFMRRTGKLRAVHRECRYTHVERPPGTHLRPETLPERLRKTRNRWARKLGLV
ncbi:MAG: hypothetical protein AAF581_17210 [Planctomycetota bacterium]